MIETVNIDIFGCRVHFAIDDDDITEMLKKIKRKGRDYKTLKKLKENVQGICYRRGTETYIVLIKNTLDVLVHECLHAVKGITMNRGVYDEETECYMLDYIIAQIVPKLNLKPMDSETVKEDNVLEVIEDVIAN